LDHWVAHREKNPEGHWSLIVANTYSFSFLSVCDAYFWLFKRMAEKKIATTSVLAK